MMMSEVAFVRLLLVAMFLSLATTAFACRPRIESASEFFQRASQNAVGFTGKVVSVEREQETKGGIPLLVTIKTKKWFLGQPVRIMKARGFIFFGMIDGGSCNGFFGFRPDVGSEVTVFGEVRDGMIDVSRGITPPLPPVKFSY